MTTGQTGSPLVVRDPALTVQLESWKLVGQGVAVSEKKLKDLKGLFADEEARRLMDPETKVYTVQAYMPVAEGTPGGLFFGNTTVQPGKVRNEYFMTRGHFHSKALTAEYYWGIKGEGVLILMDANRVTRAERVFPGSLHYIAGDVAHRLANPGLVPFTIGACWYSDAGHNYDEIEKNGFSARLVEVRGVPKLVESKP
jgi:glucose-6-phosphate isomerase, archaeal